jgi:hypothetical protein
VVPLANAGLRLAALIARLLRSATLEGRRVTVTV